jgi:hypothetical protein
VSLELMLAEGASEKTSFVFQSLWLDYIDPLQLCLDKNHSLLPY